jgi:hypothetical protein
MLPTFVLLAVSTTMLLAQGRVLFNNFGTGTFYPIWTYSGLGQSNNVGANYSIQLRWATGTFADQIAFEAANPAASLPVAFFGATGGSPETDGAGLFDGGAVPIGPVGTYTMQARGWFNNGIYPTYDHAANAGQKTGRSVLFTVNVTAPPAGANHTVFPSFVINFFEVNPVPPKLDITLVNGQAVVSWPTMPNAALQSRTNLASGNWLDVPGPYIFVNGRYTVTNTVSGSARYFRLRY